MRPLFTIHAGEYLVGLHIQKRLKLNAWIPAKDTGIDMLVTNRENARAVSLQVKYGKDFLPEKTAALREKLRCLSWFTLNWKKLDESKADYWVFVLRGFDSDDSDFVVIPTGELRRRMAELHGTDPKLQSYLCSTKTDQCWETRGPKGDSIQMQIANGTYQNPARDFSEYMNDKGWSALTAKLD